MKCENLQLNLSVYLDDILTDEERAAVVEHLAKCPLCRQKLSEFQSLRRRLRVLPPPAAPENLIKSAQNRLRYEVCASGRFTKNENIREWLQMRLMPYGVGVAASLILGLTLLWSLLSAANNPQSLELARNEPLSRSAVMLTDGGFQSFENEYALNAADFAAARISVASDSPSVNPQGALVALTKSIARGKMKDDEVVVVADVFGDGLARIDEVIEPSKDRKALRELEKALKTNPDYAPPFVPAHLDQRSDTVRVVLRIQSVNVNTNLQK